MKVFVTGGAGFIGSNLVHHILEKRPSWSVVVLDALTYAGNLENIASCIASGKVAFERVDITDSRALEECFSKHSPEMVFHLAAESHVDRSIMSGDAFVKTNVLGTENMVSLSRAHKVKRFLHISTDEVYGSLGPTGRFYESTPLDPTSPYAASKASSDLMALAAAKTHNYDVIVTRCTNNYGPYQFPEKFIPLFTTHAMEGLSLPLYGDGMNVRSWLHVRDHNEALLLLAEKGESGEVYNIGGTEADEIPNKIVAEAICSLLGASTSLIKYVSDRPAHDKRYAVDFSKINKAVGWKPQVTFPDGLKETVTWYKENRQWWERIKSGAYKEYYDQNYAYRGVSA